eukprot:COSAG01_NODE_18840_length_1049_cov_2.064211_1_plen_25_part_10
MDAYLETMEEETAATVRRELEGHMD